MNNFSPGVNGSLIENTYNIYNSKTQNTKYKYFKNIEKLIKPIV